MPCVGPIVTLHVRLVRLLPHPHITSNITIIAPGFNMVWRMLKPGAIIVMLLVMCGCGSNLTNLTCNVTIGPTQGIINHDSTQECINPGLVTLPDGNLLAAFYC